MAGEAVLTKLFGPYEVHFDEFHWQLVSRGAKSITRLAYCCTREGLLLRIRALYEGDSGMWEYRKRYPNVPPKVLELLRGLPDRRADWEGSGT